MRKKNRKLGGVIQFSNYTPPNPTSPPYPIKNERSLKHANTPFQNSNNPHFQNKAKCKTFLAKMSFIFMGMKTNFHINIVAVSLALKQRLGETRKWAIHIGNF